MLVSEASADPSLWVLWCGSQGSLSQGRLPGPPRLSTAPPIHSSTAPMNPEVHRLFCLLRPLSTAHWTGSEKIPTLSFPCMWPTSNTRPPPKKKTSTHFSPNPECSPVPNQLLPSVHPTVEAMSPPQAPTPPCSRQRQPRPRGPQLRGMPTKLSKAPLCKTNLGNRPSHPFPFLLGETQGFIQRNVYKTLLSPPYRASRIACPALSFSCADLPPILQYLCVLCLGRNFHFTHLFACYTLL